MLEIVESVVFHKTEEAVRKPQLFWGIEISHPLSEVRPPRHLPSRARFPGKTIQPPNHKGPPLWGGPYQEPTLQNTDGNSRQNKLFSNIKKGIQDREEHMKWGKK